GDKKSLEEKLRLAREVRLNLPSATKRDLSEMREALVSVVDRPGIISNITLTVGNLGINIEDIEILHTTEISGVLRLVICGAENTNRAAEALRECGYEVEVRGITIREQGEGQNGV
ncbi:MAG: ACT domain-containing protein, partial [Candidatus Subteraquimicrobiales bacterium]|nr:ACT domain-containing protein [Candidatus Subteraquimicrobiales bacterium]